GLATAAGMSRSTFFDRFRSKVGPAPMEYVAAWRMAVAKDMLLSGNIAMAELARRVGYGSVSAFSMAFSRHVGTSPAAFAGRRQAAWTARLPRYRPVATAAALANCQR